MADWKENKELADAILKAIADHGLDFESGEIPSDPISEHESVNRLYYGVPASLSEDLDGLLNFYSQEAGKIFGYEPDEVIGTPSVNLAPERFREGRGELFEKIIRTEKPIKGFETVRLHKSGEEVKIAAQVFPYEVEPGKFSIAAIVEKL